MFITSESYSKVLFDNNKSETFSNLPQFFHVICSKFDDLNDLFAMQSVSKQWRKDTKVFFLYNYENQALWSLSLIYCLKKLNPCMQNLSDFFKLPATKGKIEHAYQIIGRFNSLDGMKALINSPYFEKELGFDKILELTIKNNQVKFVMFLLEHDKIDPAANHNWSIEHASRQGYVEIVKLLLKDSHVNPAANGNRAI